MAELKEKTIKGVFWSFLELISGKSISFIVSLVLARLLSPSDYGLVAMAAVFFAISDVLVVGGFRDALIRKKDATEKDYDTVFWFNVIIALFVYAILYVCSPLIANFYNQPELIQITRVLGLNIIIGSFNTVQLTRLTKELDFKTTWKLRIKTLPIAGAIGIFMALEGFGVWSIVIESIVASLLFTSLLWIQSKWKPLLRFDIASFRNMFSFGSKLLLSGIINTLFNNLYPLVIGKFFTSAELGLFNRANTIKNLSAENIVQSIQKVSYPSFAHIQEDNDRLKQVYRKVIQSTVFIIFPIMIGLMISAEGFIRVVLTEKWLPMIPYLRLLCITGMLYPFQTINLNILMIKRRSGLFLRIEIIKKILSVFVILLTVSLGMMYFLYGVVLVSFLSLMINSWYSGKFIKYSLLEQLKDIILHLFTAILMGAIIYAVGIYANLRPLPLLLVQISLGAFSYLAIACLFKLDVVFEIRKLLIEKMLGVKKENK